MGQDVVLLAHGGGGELGHELVERVFVKHLANPTLSALEDAAVVALGDGGSRVALTTDSYVIQPLFFPGGDIGKLAVCGTVNDLAMRGARPLYLTAGFILEEGLALADLERVVASMAATAEAAGVRVVAGDTKVVEHGRADGLYVNTAGVGLVPEGVSVSAAAARPGDVVLVSGAVGDHGLAVMTQREGLRFEGALRSDCRPLADLVAALLAACPGVRAMRDPTRGGLATVLVEIAQRSGVGIVVEEEAIPVHEPARAAAEILGLDPLYVANEGVLVAIVPEAQAEAALAALRAHADGAEAARIGRVVAEHPGRAALRTLLGTHRALALMAGEPLPRIC